MLLSDENSQPMIIDNIDAPVKIKYFWVFDMEKRDFMLNKLVMFQEIVCPVIMFSIAGYVIEAPADWNILVYSPDTYQIDVVEISDLCKGDYSAFLFDHVNNKVVNNKIRVVDYSPSHVIHSPITNKTAMLCHPVGERGWICISPTDNYQKFLKNCAVGDLIP